MLNRTHFHFGVASSLVLLAAMAFAGVAVAQDSLPGGPTGLSDYGQSVSERVADDAGLERPSRSDTRSERAPVGATLKARRLTLTRGLNTVRAHGRHRVRCASGAGEARIPRCDSTSTSRRHSSRCTACRSARAGSRRATCCRPCRGPCGTSGAEPSVAHAVVAQSAASRTSSCLIGVS